MQLDFPTRFPILLLVFNNSIWPNSYALRYMSLPNWSDLVFDLSKSLDVISSSAAALHIYDFLLLSKCNHMSCSRPFACYRQFKISSIVYQWSKTFLTSGPWDDFLSKLKSPPILVRGMFFFYQKWNWLAKYFSDMLLTDTATHTNITLNPAYPKWLH